MGNVGSGFDKTKLEMEEAAFTIMRGLRDLIEGRAYIYVDKGTISDHIEFRRKEEKQI